MTENKNAELAEVVEKPKDSGSEQVIAADIGQVLGNARPVEQKEAVIVRAEPLKASEYVDPIEADYITERNNHIETPEWRASKEGIAMIHEALRFAGEIIMH